MYIKYGVSDIEGVGNKRELLVKIERVIIRI